MSTSNNSVLIDGSDWERLRSSPFLSGAVLDNRLSLAHAELSFTDTVGVRRLLARASRSWITFNGCTETGRDPLACGGESN